MSAADRFLKKKRAEQGSGSSMTQGARPPSMEARHGLNKMGGYQTSMGQFTGNGPDGITQPQLPTQRRMTPNGQPYMVDEGELLVVDAQTLSDFGGPEQLEQFIQQNRPNRAQPQQLACGGVPKQYYGGGVPTRQRGFPDPDQTQMLKEVKSGIEQYQEGGAPKPQESIAPKQPARTRNTLPINPTNTEEVQGPNRPDSPISPWDWKKKKKKELNQHDPINTDPVDITNPDIGPIVGPQKHQPININPGDITGPNFDPIANPFSVGPDQGWETEKKAVTDQGFTPSGDPLKTTTDPVQTTDPVTGAPVYDPSKIDEMMWNRYLGRMGAQQEAQRAGEAQRGLQAGMSEREIAGRGAIGDISRREAMGEATADFGIDVARRAEAKDQWQQQFDESKKQWQSTFDFAKEKYGDQEGQRIGADIAAGMTYDQIKAKYPNVTQADYDSMKASGPSGQIEYNKAWDAAQLQIANGDFAGAAQTLKDSLGIDVDFTDAISQSNASNFNEGFNNLNGLIASGMSWEDAINVMEKDGTFEKLGMAEGDVEKLYNNMQLQSNPVFKITQNVQDLVDAGIIPQDQADDYVDFLIWSQMNPQGVDISSGYSIKDKNGNEVNFFKDEAEANKFLEDNKDKGYESVFMDKHFGPSGTTGTGTGTGTGAKPKETYEIFFDEQVPSGPNENNDWFTQSIWEDLDKPKTWEEAMEKIGPVGKMWNEHERDTTLFDDQGKLDYKTDEVKDILKEIENGNAFAIEKYGVAEDSAVNTMLEAIKANPASTTGMFGQDMAGGGEALGITKEDIEQSIGKIITYTDNTGKERKVIVKSYEEKEDPIGGVHQNVTVYDIETGKEIGFGYRIAGGA